MENTNLNITQFQTTNGKYFDVCIIPTRRKEVAITIHNKMAFLNLSEVEKLISHLQSLITPNENA